MILGCFEGGRLGVFLLLFFKKVLVLLMVIVDGVVDGFFVEGMIMFLNFIFLFLDFWGVEVGGVVFEGCFLIVFSFMGFLLFLNFFVGGGVMVVVGFCFVLFEVVFLLRLFCNEGKLVFGFFGGDLVWSSVWIMDLGGVFRILILLLLLFEDLIFIYCFFCFWSWWNCVSFLFLVFCWFLICCWCWICFVIFVLFVSYGGSGRGLLLFFFLDMMGFLVLVVLFGFLMNFLVFLLDFVFRLLVFICWGFFVVLIVVVGFGVGVEGFDFLNVFC